MTGNDKLDILYKYQEMDELSKEQIKQAIRLTRDKSSLVRLEAAECLFQEYPTTARVLMRLAKDHKDDLIEGSITCCNAHNFEKKWIMLLHG